MPGPPVTARNSKVLSRKVIRQERKVKKDKKKYLEKKFKVGITDFEKMN